MRNLKSKDYLGQPVDVRQGRLFEEWSVQGHCSIEPLPFLHGRKWDDTALAFVHGVRPSHLRVVCGSAQCDAQPWRVTVWLEDDGETIFKISQEISVGLPEGIRSGHELRCSL